MFLGLGLPPPVWEGPRGGHIKGWVGVCRGVGSQMTRVEEFRGVLMDTVNPKIPIEVHVGYMVCMGSRQQLQISGFCL